MRIKYKASLDDVVAFNKFRYGRSPSTRRSIIVAGIIIPLSVFIFMCLNGLYAGAWDLPIVGAILSGALMLWVLGGQRRRIEKVVRQLLSEGSNKLLIGEHELEITETGLVYRSEYEESKYASDVIERIGFTPDYIFIFTSSMSGISIAKSSVFEGDYEAFGEELKRRFEEKFTAETVRQKRFLGGRTVMESVKTYKQDAGFGKHSGHGIASFIIAMTIGLFDLSLFVIMVTVGAIVPELIEQGSAFFGVFVSVIMFGFLANIIGVGLGISGLCQRNRKKVFPALGLIFNLMAVIFFVILISIGMMMS